MVRFPAHAVRDEIIDYCHELGQEEVINFLVGAPPLAEDFPNGEGGSADETKLADQVMTLLLTPQLALPLGELEPQLGSLSQPMQEHAITAFTVILLPRPQFVLDNVQSRSHHVMVVMAQSCPQHFKLIVGFVGDARDNGFTCHSRANERAATTAVFGAKKKLVKLWFAAAGRTG